MTEKAYLIFQAKKKLLGTQLTILGTVDGYEADTIWIEIQNIKEKDVKHFKNLTSVQKM